MRQSLWVILRGPVRGRGHRAQPRQHRRPPGQQVADVVDGELEAAAARKAEIDADVDAILDEIDDVLEENAEEFVASFVQKGGQ